MASNIKVLHRYDAFSTLVLSTKKQDCSFLKKVFVFQKVCFRVKYRIHSKFPLIVTSKHADLSNGELFWKSVVPFFRRIYALPVDFKMKPKENAFFSVKTKTNTNFAVKLPERSNHPFLLSIWRVTFFKHPHSLICDNRMYRT